MRLRSLYLFGRLYLVILSEVYNLSGASSKKQTPRWVASPMNGPASQSVHLPSPEEIRRAILLYLERAYPDSPPPAARKFIPPESFTPAEWLMSNPIERDPPDAPLEGVRSFALRLGNAGYPHMKLRLSRPPNEGTFFLSVDSHDALLFAPLGSSDARVLEELKRNNAAVASAVHAAWDAAGLLTERSYLRRKILEARQRRHGPR